jgi:hypothetical protein
MTIPNGKRTITTPGPLERLGSYVDKGAEIENYTLVEIESAPIGDIKARLDELGLDRSLPPLIAGFANDRVTLAEKVVNRLSERAASEDEIEEMPVEEVATALNNTGLNHVAGLARVHELVAAREHRADPRGDPAMRPAGVSLSRKRPLFPLKRAWVKVAWIAAAAALAIIVAGTQQYNNIQLKQQYSSLREQNASLQRKIRSISEVNSKQDKEYADLRRELDSMRSNSGGGKKPSDSEFVQDQRYLRDQRGLHIIIR